MEKVSKEICKDVVLHRIIQSDYFQTIEVQNDKLNLLQFTLDIGGSAGVSISGTFDTSLMAEIPPYETQQICVLEFQGSWSLSTRYSITALPPPKTAVMDFIEEDVNEIMRKSAKVRLAIRNFPINEIQPDHVATLLGEQNFVDPYFPPIESSLSSGADEMQKVVHWRRPRDFLYGETYHMFDDMIEPNDIQQGELGDCWFMCALASLAERPQLVRRLFITNYMNEQGIYRVRLCKNGTWRTVTVDDYFPCYPRGSPIFSRNNGNELWVLLLEKAYAKLHGSYKLLVGGFAYEGMLDLTGCPTKTFDFEEEWVQDMIDEDNFWNKIVKYDLEGALLSASTPGEDRWTETGGPEQTGGLVPGHAYTVIAAKEAYGNRLMNIRNPWGSFEWEGDWSDESYLWNSAMKEALQPSLDANDGTFWMSYDDFLKNYKCLNVCMVKNFQESRMRGKFQRLEIEGQEVVKSRWYYTLRITEPTSLIIGCHQTDERIMGVEQRCGNIDMGIAILQYDRGQYTLFAHEPNATKREVQLEVQLPEGTFVVLPMSMGCYVCRPLAAERENITLLSGDYIHPFFINTLRDIFTKFDLQINDALNYNEFAMFMQQVGCYLGEPDYQYITQQYPSSKDGLTIDGFIEYWKTVIREAGEATAWQWLQVLGYDEDLYSVRSRSIVVTFHSDTKIHIQAIDAAESSLDDIALGQILEQDGQAKTSGGDLQLYSIYREDANGFTYGVHNNCDRWMEVNFDCTNNSGMLFSSGKVIVKKDVAPNSWAVLQHAQIARDIEGSCSVRPSFRYRPT